MVLAACIVTSLLARVLPTDTRQAVAGPIHETFIGPLIRLQVQAERARGAFVSRDISAARLDSLVLRVTATNERARRLYEHAGFTVFGREPAAIRVANVPYDKLLMIRWLA